MPDKKYTIGEIDEYPAVDAYLNQAKLLTGAKPAVGDERASLLWSQRFLVAMNYLTHRAGVRVLNKEEIREAYTSFGGSA